MKRYIRTKDGIYKPDGETEDGLYLFVKVKGGWNYLPKEPILKEADTIEELCDCVVYECFSKAHQDEYHRHEVGSVESLEWNREPKRFENVYGSIWVDGNLMKVAKMNKKGELELL